MASAKARFQAAAVATLGLGGAAGLTGTAFALVKYNGQLHYTQAHASRLALVLSLAAAGWLTCGLGIALFLRSRDDGAEQQPSYLAGGSIQQQILATERSLHRYQMLSFEQAKGAFVQSQRAMFLALLVLVCGAASILVAPTTEVRILLGVFTAFGSGFSAFLSATFLAVFRQSVIQLNRAHHIPVVKNLALLASVIAGQRSRIDVDGASRSAGEEDGAMSQAPEMVLESVVTALLGVMSTLEPIGGDGGSSNTSPQSKSGDTAES